MMETIINNVLGFFLMLPSGAKPENSVLDDTQPPGHHTGLHAQDTSQK